eukprot:Pgem_evm1s12447
MCSFLYVITVYGGILIGPKIVSSLRLAACRKILDDKGKDTDKLISISSMNETLLARITKIELYFVNIHYILIRHYSVTILYTIALFVFSWDFGLISFASLVIGFILNAFANVI